MKSSLAFGVVVLAGLLLPAAALGHSPVCVGPMIFGPRGTLAQLSLRAGRCSRRVVVLGSSTANGGGASGPTASWVGRLTSLLAAEGITVVNSSIPSSNTTDSIARFDRDVRPLEPAFVVLATSIANEGINDQNVDAVTAVFIRNTRRLISLVEGIGATPVLVTPYPNSIFSPKTVTALQTISATFESEGLTVWDFLSSTMDAQGHWLPGLSIDGAHPTDAGHLRLFEAIPASFFAFATELDRPLPPMGRSGSWRSDPSGGIASIVLTLPNPALAWSAAVWLKPDVSRDTEKFLSVEGLDLTLVRMGQRVEVTHGGQTLAAAELPELDRFSHVCVTYLEFSGLLKIYINGVEAVSAPYPSGRQATGFTFGGAFAGPSLGTGLGQILVYRTALTAGDVMDVASGRTHNKSLEVDAPLQQSSSRRNGNRANTAVELAVTGAWNWVPDNPR